MEDLIKKELNDAIKELFIMYQECEIDIYELRDRVIELTSSLDLQN